MGKEERKKEEKIKDFRKDKQWMEEKQKMNKLCLIIHQECFGQFSQYKEK